MTNYNNPTNGPSRRQVAGARFKAGLNLVMGIIYVILGAVVVSQKGFGAIALDNIVAYLLGGLFALYGLFRVWRGFTDYKHMRQGIE